MVEKKETIKKNAAKKPAPKKKTTAKKTATKKNVEEIKLNNENLNELNNATNEAKVDFIEKEENNVAAVDAEPTVLDNTEHPKKENVAEKKESKLIKITKKISRSFGYLWNGQAIDY